MGHSAAKNLRALFLRICWDSLSPNCMDDSLVTLGQAEHEMADDVALDLAGSGFDGISAAAQILVRPLAFVERIGGAVRELAVRPQNFHRDLLEALVQLAPKDFLNRTFGSGHAGFIDARERTKLVHAHHFDFGVNLRELLPNQ